MTEIPTNEDREIVYTAVPYLKVTRLQAHPENGERSYCVMQKLVKPETGEYAGWKPVSKTYEHSTSAFAALGRLTQQFISLNHRYLPVEQR